MIIEQSKVSIKRSEWECFIDTPDHVIELVNDAFGVILQTSRSPVYAQQRIYQFCQQEEYRVWGFSDSECNQCATDVINKYFKSDIDRWEMLSLKGN